jgi:hypothetical protein
MNSSVDTPRKSGDGKDGIEDGLKSGVFAFLRQHVHLEEPLVGVLSGLRSGSGFESQYGSWKNWFAPVRQSLSFPGIF